jgi:ABC-2 type transport system ATP-binding protein
MTSAAPSPIGTRVGAPFISVSNLGRRFGSRVALDGLSFEVGRGETFGLLGPNGAGKTTAFRLLAGLLPLHDGKAGSDGTIRLADQVQDPRDRGYRARIGVVFQSPSIDLKLSARENLLLGAALYGLSRARARPRIAEALSLMSLADRADEPATALSGGMRRRLEIARVLLHDPEVLLLDEPGQGIDPATLRRIWDEIAALKADRGASVIVTTHQPEEAERCDRIGILDAGRLVATGTPDELRARVSGDVLHVRGRGPEEIANTLHARLGLPAKVIEDLVVVETGATLTAASSGTAASADTAASSASVLTAASSVSSVSSASAVSPSSAATSATSHRPVTGHEWVPRVAELFAPGRLESVAVRRPTLADVFVKLTGHGLERETVRPS